MKYFVSVKTMLKPYEYRHYEVPEDVYVYIKQLEAYIKHPKQSKLKQFYKDRFKK